MRSFFLSCVIVSYACGCTTKPIVEAKSATATVSSATDEKIGKCNEGVTSGKYGCSENEICPYLVDDVREQQGFAPVLGDFKIDSYGGEVYGHVRDTCQHYFCRVDMDCSERGGSVLDCMIPTGCMLVHRD